MADAKIKISAEDGASRVLAQVRASLDDVGTLAGKVGGIMAVMGGLSVGGILAMAKAAIDGVDALNDLKDATGASIENISALEDVAARTGTSFDTVGASLIKFNAILNSASPDSSAARAIKAIGLDAEALKKIDPAEALRLTAVALDGFADDGNKARIVQELFGKSVKDVAPFLKDLASQTVLVATVTTEQADEAEKLNKQLADLGKNYTDIERAIVGPVATALNKAITKFKEARLAGKDFFESLTANYWDNVREFYGMQPPKGPQASGLLTNPDAPLPKPSVVVRDPDPKKTRTPSASKTDPLAESKRYLESLQRQIEKTQELSAVDKALADLQSGRIGRVSDTLEAQIMAAARQVDAEKELVQVTKMRRAEAMALGDEVSKSNEEYQALLGRLLGATPSAALEKQRSDVRLLADEFEAGRISEELYVEAILARLDLTSGKLDTAKDKGEEMQYVFTNAFKGMEDSLVSFVQTGKLDFSSLANSMIADMARVAIQQSITKPLVGAATSFLAGMFADGAAFDSGGVHAFANGGTFTNSIVSSPTPFMFANGGGFSQGIMGEAGDEAVMPLARGADGSLGVRASGGGGGSSMVVNVIESPGNGGQQNRRTENGVDVLDIMVEKIKSSIAGDISKGSGAVPAAMSRTYGLNRTVGAY